MGPAHATKQARAPAQWGLRYNGKLRGPLKTAPAQNRFALE